MSARDYFPYPVPLPNGPSANVGGYHTYLAMCDEIDQLRRWKAEATIVLNRWDEVAARVDLPIGAVKSIAVGAEIDRLRDYCARLRTELAKHGWGDFHYGSQAQDPAIVALLSEEP